MSWKDRVAQPSKARAQPVAATRSGGSATRDDLAMAMRRGAKHTRTGARGGGSRVAKNAHRQLRADASPSLHHLQHPQGGGGCSGSGACAPQQKKTSGGGGNSGRAGTVPKHVLHDRWTLYYHSPTSSDWSNASYTKVASFHTIEGFTELFRVLDTIPELHYGMLFLMRGNILPTWEDKRNCKGGCWSYKVSGETAVLSTWKQLAVRLTGETLSTVPMLLNGLSMSPKRGFCILKIWNRDSQRKSKTLLDVNDLTELEKHGEALYTPFCEKK